MPREQLMPPLSTSEIASILGNIRNASTESGVGAATAATAVSATALGLQQWCGDTEVMLAMLSTLGIGASQRRPS